MKNLIVINVLAKEVYDDCRIKDSINVPRDELAAYAKDLDRETPIVVYCASYMCSASRLAWHTLDDMGFKNIWAYEGGMAEWRQRGLPSEGACAKEHLTKDNSRPEKQEDEAVREITVEKLRAKMTT